MKYKIKDLLNLVFRLLLIFSCVFIWIRYFIQSLILSILLTCLASLLIDFLIQFLLNKKNYINSLKNEEIKKIEKLKNTFIFSEETKTINFFLTLANTKHKATKKTNYILIEHENQNVILYPHFTFRKFNIDDLVYILNKTKKNSPSKIVICADKFENDCQIFSKKLDVKILLLDSEQTYLKLLKNYDCFPTELNNFKELDKIKFKELFSNAISKNKTKGYLFSSLIILVSSYFIKFNIYYIFISTLLLVLSLICFISPKLKHPLPENIL